MGILILPLEPIRRLIRKGAIKIFGKEELKDFKTDLVVPVAAFADEVYDDTVVDMLKQRSEKKGNKDKDK